MSNITSDALVFPKLDFDALMDEAERLDTQRRKQGQFADFACPICEEVHLLCPVCGVCMKYCHNDYFHELDWAENMP